MDKPLNDSQRIIQHEIVLLATCLFLKRIADWMSLPEIDQVNEILADARELMPQYSEQLRGI